MSVMKIYSLEDYNNISWNQNSKFKISEESIKVIENIANQVTDPNYIRTPIFTKNNTSNNSNNNTNAHVFNKKKKNNNFNINYNEDDWKMIRNFKKTEIVKKDQTEDEKNFKEIRLLLNQISEKNFDQVIVKIIEKMNILQEKENKNEDDENILENYRQINTIIFNNASTNKVLSEVYANLFKELLNKYKKTEELFNKDFKNYITLFENIEYIDPNVDYDKFCLINLENDKRRSTSLFLCNLLKNEILKVDDIMHIIFQLQNLLFTNIEKDGFVEQNSEIGENLFILITNSYKILKKHNECDSIINNVEIIKNLKAKEKPSISNKIIFKHMDIIDYCNKNNI